jgi:hypothetical protein
MVLVGHSQRLSEPLTSRQRRALAATGIALVLAVVLAGVLALTGPSGTPASRDGCINVSAASSTGTSLLHACGATARGICATAYSGAGPEETLVARQCRLAGIARPRRG